MPLLNAKSVALRCLFACLLVFCWQGLYAQVYVPKYSNEFLSIGVGARGQAMGSALTAVSTDVTAGYWNPAGLAEIKNKYRFGLMHAEFFAGVANYDYAGFATPIDSQSTLGISFIRFGVDDIPDTRFLIQDDNIDYSRVRRFSSSDNALLFSYARRNFGLKGLNAGANFKIIYRNAGVFANAWGFGLDAGVQYRRKGLMLGLMARDVTSTFNAWSYNTAELASVYALTNNNIPQSSVEITLPKFIFGVGYYLNVGAKVGVLTSLDLNATFDGRRNVPISTSFFSADPSVGLEANYNQIVFARFGVNNIQQVKNWDGTKQTVFQPNFGVGLRLHKMLTLDYALSKLGSTTESVYTNIFSLQISLY